MEIIWLMLGMWLAAEAPKWGFPEPIGTPNSRALMSNGQFAGEFKRWGRQCGWYLLILIGCGAHLPDEKAKGVVYFCMPSLM